MRHKKIGAVLLLSVLSVAVLYLLQCLLRPKYMSNVVEGAFIREYYEETTTHDVLFIGDCEVYGNFSPVTLWEEYGITSYIRGSAQQLIWQSYYLLEDTLRYEKPEIVVFNVLSMKYSLPQNEAYNRMTLDGMKWSTAKLKAIKASMTEEEHLIEYVFPLLRFHSRWNELESDDFRYMFQKDIKSHNGYYMRIDVKPAMTFPEGKKLPNYQFGDINYDYLNQIKDLCMENDVQLVLIKAPSLSPAWYEQWEAQIVDYAKENNLPYINFLNLTEAIGIDYTKDTYDGGLHLNLSGAEKLSTYFGKYLRDEYFLTDWRENADLKAVWDEKIQFYYDMKAAQEKELLEYGYIKK